MITSEEILENLVGFPTISRTPNLELINYLRGLLEEVGAETFVVGAEDGENLNLHAHLGPKDVKGVMLSGHTDVVPVAGQDWTKQPFRMENSDGKYYGRGTTDMKGFVACATHAMIKASERDLKMPLQLAFSYDEEIGCVGVRSLIDMLSTAPNKPAFCIVGEPTELKVATGHKGKTAIRVTCTGKEAHSALAPTGLNAIYLAADVIQVIREQQAWLVEHGGHDDDYDVAYSTLHVGKIQGGVALNIVPNQCTLDFEIRNLAQDDPEAILERISSKCADIVQTKKRDFPEANIELEVFNTYPGLNTPEGHEVIAFTNALVNGNDTCKVAFGTEGGLFDQVLGIPTVVCGPGSMDQGHKPDEYISHAQLDACDAMMANLVRTISKNT